MTEATRTMFSLGIGFPPPVAPPLLLVEHPEAMVASTDAIATTPSRRFFVVPYGICCFAGRALTRNGLDNVPTLHPFGCVGGFSRHTRLLPQSHERCIKIRRSIV